MTLYSISNKDILDNKALRWRSFCLELDLLHIKPKKATKFKLKWNNEKFLKKNLNNIPKSQGIYMFVLNIENKIDLNGTCKYVLYIGQTRDLNDRFDSYFKYKTSTNPSDLLKRSMILIWERKLDFHFFETKTFSQKDLDDIEMDLIDSVVPPLNQLFRGRILKQSIKLYAPR